MKWTLVLGTARSGAKSKLVVNWINDFLNNNFKAEIRKVDISDFVLSRTVPADQKDPVADKWREIVEDSDGFFIVTPEYNKSFPGELKILLDSTYVEYKKKPVAICGVSAGGFGAVQAVSSLQQYLWNLQMITVNKALYVSNVNDLFDDQGSLLKSDHEDKLKVVAKELEWFSDLLKNS